MAKVIDRSSKWVATQKKILKGAEKSIADSILARATVLAPKLTGALRADGQVKTEQDRTVVTFGGDSVPYARRRHFENKKNPHTLHYLKRGGDSVKKEGVRRHL